MEFAAQSDGGEQGMSTVSSPPGARARARGNCSISPQIYEQKHVERMLDFDPRTGESERDRMAMAAADREHMFDKVVTPSDVGKLNRLVIPKQHAEKYFPLDSSNNDKGLLLNFEDRTGKCWRFRYSYWNSSQSYVMTKGWSRFVKDKKLDAGDIVSFHRAPAPHDRLFIDWCRRPSPSSAAHHFNWSPLLMRPPPPHPTYYHPSNHQQLQYYHPYRHGPKYPYGVPEGVYSSVPVVQGRAGPMGKKLRLFGVNMELDDGDSSPIEHAITVSGASQLSSPSHPHLQLRLYNGTPLHLHHHHHPNIVTDNKGKAISNSNSLSLDLDLDLDLDM